MAHRYDEILRDPSASHWLKDALRAIQDRDILDALIDVEVLHSIVQEQYDARVREDCDTRYAAHEKRLRQ